MDERLGGFDWDAYWGRFGDLATSVPGTLYRERLIFDRLGRLGTEDRLLDVGCGVGELAESLRRAFPTTPIRGIDVAPSGVEAATRRVPDAKFSVRDLMQDVVVPEDEQGWATHAVCSEVLEHVDDPIGFLERATVYFGRRCRIVVTVPSGPRTNFDREIGHVRHFTPAMLDLVLRSAGLEVERIDRAGFPFHNLYKLAVALRGKKLMNDLSTGEAAGELPAAVRYTWTAFNRAFAANLENSPFGWQIVAVAVANG